MLAIAPQVLPLPARPGYLSRPPKHTARSLGCFLNLQGRLIKLTDEKVSASFAAAQWQLEGGGVLLRRHLQLSRQSCLLIPRSHNTTVEHVDGKGPTWRSSGSGSPSFKAPYRLPAQVPFRLERVEGKGCIGYRICGLGSSVLPDVPTTLNLVQSLLFTQQGAVEVCLGWTS